MFPGRILYYLHILKGCCSFTFSIMAPNNEGWWGEGKSTEGGKGEEEAEGNWSNSLSVASGRVGNTSLGATKSFLSFKCVIRLIDMLIQGARV